jgi:hypothetical protein
MTISKADLAEIAKTVWTVDGIIAAPDGSKTNPYWRPERVLADLEVQVRALEVAIAAVASKTGADTKAVIAGVLKGLDPAGLADAIATSLGPEVGQQVVTALQQRLAAPPSPPA